jgi:type I restriction enzyme R subunit
MPLGPEDIARENIDRMLEQAGWAVHDVKQANLFAKKGVAIREFELKSGYGTADYLLSVDGKAAGVIEAKKAGSTLTGVEIQSAKYSNGLSDSLPACPRPLLFCYQSTGIETRFTNGFDPEPCSRQVFYFHKLRSLNFKRGSSPHCERPPILRVSAPPREPAVDAPALNSH